MAATCPVTLHRAVSVAVGLVWSRALFPEKCTIGWKYGIKPVPCPWAAAYLPCGIAQPWMFLALLRCGRHWLHCPSKKCCPTWQSFLLLTSHTSVTAVPSWVTPLSSFSTFCVQLEASAWLFPLLLMSLQLPSVVSGLGLMFPALSCLSAGIPWGWGEWAALDSSSLVPPAVLDSVLSRLCTPSQVLVFLWCVRPRSEPYTEPSPAQSPLTLIFMLISSLVPWQTPFPTELAQSYVWRLLLLSVLSPSPISVLPSRSTSNTAYLLSMFISSSCRTDLGHVCLRTFWPAFLCFSLSCSFWHARNTI